MGWRMMGCHFYCRSCIFRDQWSVDYMYSIGQSCSICHMIMSVWYQLHHLWVWEPVLTNTGRPQHLPFSCGSHFHLPWHGGATDGKNELACSCLPFSHSTQQKVQSGWEIASDIHYHRPLSLHDCQGVAHCFYVLGIGYSICMGFRNN